MQQTETYKSVLPSSILSRYEVMETGSAAKIIEAVCPEELKEILEVLDNFKLTSELLLSPGGNKGPVPTLIDSTLHEKGWIEARVDLEKKVYFFEGHNTSKTAENEECPDNLVSRIYQKGYAIDNVKGRLAADIEWNPKDGNLDRDFAAYRAWFDEGIIVAAILITRLHDSTKDLTREIWADFISRNPQHADKKQPVDYRTTTTANYEKAVQRILRGDLGTCPILMFGIGEGAWDEILWTGNVLKWDKEGRKLVPCPHKFEVDSSKSSKVTYSVQNI